MAAALLPIIPLAVLLILGSFIKLHGQAMRDHQRKAYALSFPSDLNAKLVVNWVHSISGMFPSRRLSGVPTLVFETWATDRGITYLLHVPWQLADYIIGQLRVSIPGASATPIEKQPAHNWTQVVEVGESKPDRALRVLDPESLAHSLLGSVQALQPNEAVLIQWVVAPTRPKSVREHEQGPTYIGGGLFGRLMTEVSKSVQPDKQAISEAKEKLAETNVSAVLRVAARASTDPRASHLIRNVRGAFASVNGPHNQFVRTWTPAPAIHGRIAAASAPIGWPARLAASELAGLISWPLGSPHVAGLPRGRTRHMPATEAVPRKGALIGRSTFPGSERPVALSPAFRAQHLHVMGSTGCLHPDTPIYDPCDGTTKTVKQRHEEAAPFHVISLHMDKLRVARADKPIKFRKVGMYRLYNDATSIVVTGEHRVWNGQAYVEVATLYQQQGSSSVLLPSIAGDDLSRLYEDVQRSLRTAVGSQGGYQRSRHYDGQPPRAGVGSGQASVPLQAGAHVPGCCHLDMDDRGHTEVHNRPHLVGDHRSRRNSLRPSTPDHARPLSDYFEINTFKVERVEDEIYYDFHVPIFENYLACGIINHNTGKTTLLTNLIAYDMQVGNGVLLIDPKGDLFRAVLARVPKERLKDVIVMDINDAQFPVGFNPLRDGTPEHAVSQLIKLLEARYPDMRRGGVWAPAGFFRGLTTLANWPGAAFPDIVPLLSPQWATDPEALWRQEVMASVKDENTATFWQRYLNEPPTTQDRYAQPVIDRAWQFNERPVLKNIIGQSQSTFDMRDVAEGRKMLFVNLHGPVDEEAAKLLGSMLLNSFYNHAMNRRDRSVFVGAHLDEFADLVQLPVSFEEMLAKLRSSNIGLTLAHQDMGQLRKRPDLMSTVMANARSKVLFNMSADDGRTFANEFRGRVTDTDFIYLNQYETIARLMTDQGVSDPMTVKTFDYLPAMGTTGQVRLFSQQQFGRPRFDVEAEIRGRRKPTEQSGKPKRKPARGQTDWKP